MIHALIALIEAFYKDKSEMRIRNILNLLRIISVQVRVCLGEEVGDVFVYQCTE